MWSSNYEYCKTRSKEDTWKPEELERSMKEIEKEKRRGERRPEMNGDAKHRTAPESEKKDRSKRSSEKHHDSKERRSDKHRDERTKGDNESHRHRDDRKHGDDRRTDDRKLRDERELDERKHERKSGDRKHKDEKHADDRKHRSEKHSDDRKHRDGRKTDDQKHEKHKDERKHREEKHEKHPDERKHHSGETNHDEKTHKSDRHRDDRTEERRHKGEDKRREGRDEEERTHRRREEDHHKSASDKKKHSSKELRQDSGDRERRHEGHNAERRHHGDRLRGDDTRNRSSSRENRRPQHDEESAEGRARAPMSVKSVVNRPMKFEIEQTGANKIFQVPTKKPKLMTHSTRPEQRSSKEVKSAEEVGQRSRVEPQVTATQSLRKQPNEAISKVKVDDSGGDDYEDDFEDYDDDFEDDDDDVSIRNAPSAWSKPPPTPIRPLSIQMFKPDWSDGDSIKDENAVDALELENERLTGNLRSAQSTSTDLSEDRGHSPRGRSVINFGSAKEKIRSNRMASKSMRRARDLLSMIELDMASFDMIDLPAVNEYELYIRSFGRSNTQQTYVQTNEEDTDRDTQTDAIETRQSWTQHPSDSHIASSTEAGAADDDTEVKGQQKFTVTDTTRLANFIQNAGHVMLVLLEEELANETQSLGKANQSNISISKGFVKLGNMSLLQGRKLTSAKFCENLPHLVLTSHSRPLASEPSMTPGLSVNPQGMLCVWNTKEPSLPQKYLSCESVPVCCCFSPPPANLVFAGFCDGSIVVWDLREGSYTHTNITTHDGVDVTLRRPTYNTAGVLQQDNHCGAVTNIAVSHSALDSASQSSTSFQLVSVDEFGTINFWVCGELGRGEEAGSETDLGLSPGGRVKLIRMSVISLNKSFRSDNLPPIKLSCFQVSPRNHNHFFAGTESGSVISCSRFGKHPTPRCFTSYPESPVEVTCIDLSPFKQPCFLAGYRDGSVRLYNLKSDTSVSDWSAKTPTGQPITSVKWSPTRPSLFYVLTPNHLMVYDLIETDRQPIASEKFNSSRVIGVDFTVDQSTSSISTHRPQMLISTEDGGVEIHELQDRVSEVQTLELEYLENFIERY